MNLEEIKERIGPMIAFQRIYGTPCTPAVSNAEAGWLIKELESAKRHISALEEQLVVTLQKVPDKIKKTRRKRSEPSPTHSP